MKKSQEQQNDCGYSSKGERVKNYMIKFKVTRECYQESKEFAARFFPEYKTSATYRFIFQEGIQAIKQKLFKGKIPKTFFVEKEKVQGSS